MVADAVPKPMVKFAQELTAESIVDVEGVLRKAEQQVVSCTVQQFELDVRRLFVVSAAALLPIQVTDCSVPQPVLSAQKKEQEALQKEIDALLARKAAGEDVEVRV